MARPVVMHSFQSFPRRRDARELLIFEIGLFKRLGGQCLFDRVAFEIFDFLSAFNISIFGSDVKNLRASIFWRAEGEGVEQINRRPRQTPLPLLLLGESLALEDLSEEKFIFFQD